MPSRRDDYILRIIEQIRIMVAAAVKFRDSGKIDQALLSIVSAQEKLFARPAPSFMGLPLDEQLRLLCIDEPPDSAREKCLSYAALLTEAGRIYEVRDNPTLAISAFQSALYVMLAIPANSAPPSDEVKVQILHLLDRIPPEAIQAPVRERLILLGLSAPAS